MSSGPRFALYEARRQVAPILDALRPACERLEIAGSVRRRRPTVGDVEVVIVPVQEVQAYQQRGLFGDEPGGPKVNAAWAVVDALVEDGRLVQVKGGDRYRQLRLPSGLGLDLFAVLPPAEFGVIFTIRTGPAEFSATLMKSLQRMGRRCEDGRVLGVPSYCNGTAERCDCGVPPCGLRERVPCPEEVDFFRAAGFAWIEPEQRGEPRGRRAGRRGLL